MRKTVYCFMLVFAVTTNLFTVVGQRQLVSKELKGFRVLSTEKNEGLIIVSCPEALNLEFRTNWGEPIRFYEQPKIEGGNKVYSLLFSTEKDYDGRKLYVMAPSYDRLEIFIPLQKNEIKEFNVDDPDVLIIDCYYELDKEATKLFKSGMYDDAKKKYESSKGCSKVKTEKDIDKEEHIISKIRLIDSIIQWKAFADAYYDNLDYGNAIILYQKIYAQNAGDKYVSDKLVQCNIKKSDICSNYYKSAENYYNEKNYDAAKPLYEKMVSLSCANAAEAEWKLQTIQTWEANRRQCARVLTYEYANKAPVGLSIGGYKDHKWSGYFTLRFNTELFEVLRSNAAVDVKPELNISFGWTKKIVKPVPVWLFFTPFGYTGVGQYKANVDKEHPELSDLKVYHAVSPEAGLLGKIILGKGIGIALRYTFQYRFAIDKETIDYMGKTRHVFGLGVCF